jgi:parallel beta-helix repeat protein
MQQKSMRLLLIAVTACALAPAAVALPEARASACAAVSGGGAAEVMNGDWVVNSDQTVENRTIQLNGTLRLQSGTLTLRNAWLQINAGNATNGFQGAALSIQINNGNGQTLAIYGSRITMLSSTPGSIEIWGQGGSAPANFSASGSCFEHAELNLVSAGAVEIDDNEFTLQPSDSINAITINQVGGAKVSGNTFRALLDPSLAQTAQSSGGVGLMFSHDCEVVNNTLIGLVGAFGLYASWNNHFAGNYWRGTMALAGFAPQAANWWSLIDNGWPSIGGLGAEWASNNNLVEHNTFIGGHSAMLFSHDSSGNVFSQNTIQGGGYGIGLRWGGNNIVDGNRIIDMWDNAIHAHHTHANRITNNQIFRSGGGISIYSSADNLVQSNTVADSNRGIFIHESTQTTVTGNTVSGVTQGLILASNSNSNTVTANNIVSATHPAWDDSTGNTWQGNFWASLPSSAIPPASVADSTRASSFIPFAAAPVPSLQPPPTTEPVSATTVIQGQQVWQGAYTVNSAIVIPSGASLALQGATLTYVLTQPTIDIWMDVQSGGSLTILDSQIIGPVWDHSFEIKVEKGAQLTMKRSEIDNAGSWVGTYGAAVASNADNIDIEDSTFKNVYCAYASENGPLSNGQFINNKVIQSVKAISLGSAMQSGAVITGNQISRYGEWGIDFSSPPGYTQSQLLNNDFSAGWGPAIYDELGGGGFTISGNTCADVQGPCVLTDSGGIDFRSLHTATLSSTGSSAGDAPGVSAIVGNLFTNPGELHPAANIFSVSLAAAGTPAQQRYVALPFGELQRIGVSAPASTAGPYSLTAGAVFASASQPAISKSALAFAARPGTAPPSQLVRVVNAAWNQPAWNWSAATSANWLHVTPASGEADGELTVSADTTGLAEGQYSGEVQLTTPGQAPQTVDVTLTVSSTSPVVTAAPAALRFVDAYSNNASQRVAISASFGALPVYLWTRTELGGNWLSATISSGTLPATLTVTVNPDHLAAGEYAGDVMLSVAGAAASPVSIPVTLSVPANGGRRQCRGACGAPQPSARAH